MAPPHLTARESGSGVTTYDAGARDFLLHRIAAPATVSISGPAIALAEEGRVILRGRVSELELHRGGSVFISPDEIHVEVGGEGAIWLATTPAP